MLSYFSRDDGDVARRQRAVHTALNRLTHEGVVVLDSPQRYRITPLVEIVLSAERLRELEQWLREQAADEALAGDEADAADGDADHDEADADIDEEDAR